MRVCIVVLDGVGIGAMPDAADYGDAGAHTLGNVFTQQGRLDLPNMYAMGLAHIEGSGLVAAMDMREVSTVADTPAATAAYGRMAAKTRAKDTTSGHWELAGLIMEPPFATFEKFPQELLLEWLMRAADKGLWQLNSTGKMVWQGAEDVQQANAPQSADALPQCGVSQKAWSPQGLTPYLGNYPASGTQIIDELGEAHMQTGAPIVYTSADSVFQVAAHEEIIPIQIQYQLCQLARELLNGNNLVGRVIARPFVGKPGAFTRTKNRRDYAVPPTGETLLDALAAKGHRILGIGKIEDIFCSRGVTSSILTKTNTAGIDATIEALKSNKDASLIFTNLVDFDMLYGHRNDPEGFAKALEDFDSRLPEILAALAPQDILIITSDHGCDPTTASTDHSREYVPILVYGEAVQTVNLGTRSTLADVAASICKYFGLEPWPVGESFL